MVSKNSEHPCGIASLAVPSETAAFRNEGNTAQMANNHAPQAIPRQIANNAQTRRSTAPILPVEHGCKPLPCEKRSTNGSLPKCLRIGVCMRNSTSDVRPGILDSLSNPCWPSPIFDDKCHGEVPFHTSFRPLHVRA